MKKRIIQALALIMAAVMLTACACSKEVPVTEETQEIKTGFLEASEEPAVYDYAIQVSINPVITLFIWDDTVQAWRFDNEDAKFAYYGINFEGLNPEDAVKKVVETAVDAGYVKGGNDVKMTVLEKGTAPDEEYIESLTNVIAATLAEKVEEEVQVVTETAPAPVVEETPAAETTEETKEETKEEVKTESKEETKETTQQSQPVAQQQPAQQQPAQQSQQSPAQEEHQHSWVHHDAEYQTVHHDAEYTVVHHDAEYTYVHHDAVYQTIHHDAWIEVAYPYAVYYHYKCTNCGALGTDSPPTCHGGYQSGNFGLADLGPAVEVVLAPAYDEQILVEAAYDEQVLVKEAYDETVLVKEAYDETVLVKEAYDECSSCGATK